MHLFAAAGAELLLHVRIKLKLRSEAPLKLRSEVPGMLVLRRIPTVSSLGALTRACNA